MNFFDLDDASLELYRLALADAPPLSREEIDVIATLFAFTPVDDAEAELT